MKFCPRCYKILSQKWAKKFNYDPRYKLDIQKMIFPCQVPIHEPHDATGHPMVRIWNCRTNKFDTYPLKEYQRKRDQGEFEP